MLSAKKHEQLAGKARQGKAGRQGKARQEPIPHCCDTRHGWHPPARVSINSRYYLIYICVDSATNLTGMSKARAGGPSPVLDSRIEELVAACRSGDEEQVVSSAK